MIFSHHLTRAALAMAICGAVVVSVWMARATIWAPARAQIPPDVPPAGFVRPDTLTAALQMPDYLRLTTRLGLFGPAERPKPVAPPKAPAPKVPIAGKAANFELIGVVGGEAAQAIIRDRKSGSVYYVSPGQVVGELTLKTIKSRSVVVSSGDEEIEIAL